LKGEELMFPAFTRFTFGIPPQRSHRGINCEKLSIAG
jgi:hypothetical protein